MKYVLALVVGLAVGAAIFFIGIIYNPFANKSTLSPLAVTDAQLVTLTYPAVSAESIIFTNDGESRISPHPEKVLQLWEGPISKTSAMATVLRDARSQAAGFGIKLFSLSEKTRPLQSEAIVDSVWYVYLPGRGGLFIEQTENYWDYLRSVVLPGYRSSSNTWKGTWLNNVTSGPEALGTARVTGSSGEFVNASMLGVESLAVRAWRVDGGPIAADGQILIELPAGGDPDSAEDAADELN